LYSRRDTRAYGGLLYVLFFLFGLAFLSNAVEDRSFKGVVLGSLWTGLMLPSFVAMLVPNPLLRALADVANGLLLLSLGVVIVVRNLAPPHVIGILVGGYLALCGAVYLGAHVWAYWETHKRPLQRTAVAAAEGPPRRVAPDF
jgi:hypothetical protein